MDPEKREPEGLFICSQHLASSSSMSSTTSECSSEDSVCSWDDTKMIHFELVKRAIEEDEIGRFELHFDSFKSEFKNPDVYSD